MDTVIDIDTFFDRYRPIENHEGDYRFETYSEDLARVQSINPRHIWTEVDTDEGELIISGARFVNRICYYVTEVSHDFEPIEVHP